MADVIGAAVIEVTADASGVSAGIAQATQAVKTFEQAATSSGAKAGAALKRATKDTADGAAQLTREQERLINTINNYSQTVGRSRGEVLEFKAAQAGVSSQVQAQIAAIRAQEAALKGSSDALSRQAEAQRQAAQEAKAAAAAEAQSASQRSSFLGSLRDQIALLGRSSDEVMRYRAAQLGAGSAAAPLILQLQNMRAAQEGLARAAREEADAQRAATAARASRDSFVASLRQQADAIGKTRADLLELQAAQMGVTAQAAPYIARLRESEGALRGGGKALNQYGISAGQTANAFRQLPAQLTDVITQLAGGQNPLLILVQQGGQVKDSFGGIGNALKAVGSLISPLTVAAVGLGAGFAGLGLAAAHAESLQRSLNDLESQLTATGRAGLISSADLKGFINELAQAPGVTRDSASAVVSELSKVHNIGAGLFKDLAASAVDYAKATGTDLPTAARTLARAFDDPVKGAKSLDDALGTLSSTQILQIENLSKSNDLAGAQRALYDALQESVRGLATNGLTPLQKSTNDLGNAWEKTMQAFDKSDGLKNATGALGSLLGKLTQFINYLPEFEQKWKGAFSGGLNGIAMNLLGLNNAAKSAAAAGPQTGGATGSWGDPIDSKSAKTGGGSAADDAIKRALDLGKAYQGQADKISDLTKTRKVLSEAMVQSITLYGKESEQAQKLKGQISGVDDAIKSAQKKLAGPAPKAFQDDAATKYLMQLRETEASLKEQLTQNDKLTASQKELAKFEQQIADIKEKKTLTADQKSLLANEAAIEAQLKKNVAIEDEVKVREKATKEQEKQEKLVEAYVRQIESLNRSIESAQTSRDEQSERELGAFGQGDRAQKEIEAQRSIRREFERLKRQNNDEAAKAGPLGAEKYQEEADHIETSLQRALAAQQAYFDALKAKQEDWRNGATSALANYIDSVNDAAGRAKSLITESLGGITDGITGLLMGDKGSSLKDLGKKIATSITKGLVEQEITKPIAQWLQGGLKDSDSIASKLLGGLVGGKGSGLFGSLLGVDGSKASGGAGLAGVTSSSATASTALIGLADAANAASFSMAGGGGGTGGGSGMGALIGGLASAIGGFDNTTATALANSTSGDSLDNLFRYTNNFSGRAGGGFVGAGSMHQVTENGPELLTVGNKTLLMMGNNSGNVTPLRKAGSERIINNNTTINVPQTTTRQSGTQLAAEWDRKLSAGQRNT